MKTIQFLSTGFVILMLLNSCTNSEQNIESKSCDNALLPSHVYVMQEFDLTNAINPSWIKNFDHETYFRKLDQSMNAGMVPVYSNNLYNLFDLSGWKKEQIENTQKFQTDKLKSIVFLEEWFVDPVTYLFTKNIVAQGPVRNLDETVHQDRQSKELLFWYFPDTLETRNKKVKGDITYMVNFKELNSAGLNKKMFITTFFKAVLNIELKAYDFFTNEEISNKEIKTRCGFGDEQVAIMDPDDGSITYETYDKEISNKDFLTALYFDEISDVVFTEQWAVDPKDFMIHKKVKSLSLVREFYRDDDEDPGPFKDVIFKVKLD